MFNNSPARQSTGNGNAREIKVLRKQSGNAYVAIDEVDNERSRQINFGREKLTLKQPSTERKMNTHQDRNNKAPSKSQSPKVQKTGHEACLAKVVSERRKIEAHLINGNQVSGDLLEFDKFSIRVRDDNTGRVFWVFKSAIIGFVELE